MKVTITQNDIVNLKIFMLTKSMNAKKQRLVSFYAIPLEFFIVGIFIDGIFKLVPLATLLSLALALLWLFFYPKLYFKFVNKHIEQARQIKPSSIEMNLEVNDSFISFSDGKPHESEKFPIANLRHLAKNQENYFVGFKPGIYIVLPQTPQTKEVVENLSRQYRRDIESVDIN